MAIHKNMSKNKNIALYLFARLFIISFFLQNCGGLEHPPLLEADSKAVAYH
jgi:hypothetical protein